MRMRVLLVVAAGLTFAALSATADDEVARALNLLKSVSREGRGNEDAGPAWKTLVSQGQPALLPALTAIDDSNPTAANWLRTAIEAIADNEKSEGHKLPASLLESFISTKTNSAAGRQLAYQLLASQDASVKARLLPTFLNDRSLDLRRAAIEFELDKLDMTTDMAARKMVLEKLFAASRDKDQVELLAKKLAEVGVTVSIGEHLGCITHCSLVGPFDSTDGKGFAVHYPPETETSPTSKYSGKANAPLTWKPVQTADKYGTFDVNKLLDKHKDSVAYALALVVADQEMPCEIRMASPNALQLFVNGQQVFEREEYHHGSPFDANKGKALLKKGDNTIVLKICQNNQTQPWAQSWDFKLRVCDSTGGPLAGISQRLPESGKTIKIGSLPEGATVTEEKK